ncbi:phospholipid transfer protein-like isoform X5 [Acanthochromis polyacanthus]|nr:phospholipid transfer protein-like isoform X5 [Acanthochromis polyacanthus]
MTSSVYSILLVSLVFCVSVVDPTGVKIRITNQALNMLRDQAQAIVQEQLLNQPFEGFQISVCTIDRLTITQLTVHRAELRFRQNSGFQFVMQNFEARFSFNHQLDVLGFQHTGAKEFVAQGVSANMELSLIRTQQGRLAVAMPTCEASIERMTLIPRTLLNVLTGCLRHLFNFLFCPLVQRYGIPYVNQMLETIPMRAEVFPNFGISIDYSLTRDVQVTANSLDMSFNGLVFREGENIPALNPAVDPVFTENNLMAYVGVSEFVFNSAAVAFYNAGILGKKFETISSRAAKRYLRFRQFFSQPWRMRAPLAAAVELTEPPRISITQRQGVTVNLRVRVSAASVPPNREPQVITSVSATCEVTVMVTIHGSAAGNRLFLPYSNLR